MLFFLAICHKLKLVNYMLFFTGFLMGVVSLIPGISSGTILLLTNKYEFVTNAIYHFKEKKYFLILLVIILGIILGTLTFSRIIEFLFYFFPVETLIVFSSIILFDLPSFVKVNNNKINIFAIILGIAIIFILNLLSNKTSFIVFDYPKLTITFLLSFSLFGMIDGFFTILPGISGSMIMMILGPYFLYKSYLANLSLENIIFLIPLAFYFLGNIIGIFYGSKFSLFINRLCPTLYINTILGMIIMSTIILIPFKLLELSSIFNYFISILISFAIVKLIHKIN